MRAKKITVIGMFLLLSIVFLNLEAIEAKTSDNTLFDKSITLIDGQMWNTNADLKPNITYHLFLEVTSGNAVDLFVLTSTNFAKYEEGMAPEIHVEFEDYEDLSDVSIKSTSFTFTVENEIKLYFAIDNADYIIGGAPGGGEVDVNIELTSISKSNVPGNELPISLICLFLIAVYYNKKRVRLIIP